MARVTVEDCVEKVPNRFELVVKAANRARKLANGEVKPLIDKRDYKPTLIALYELAAGYTFDEEPEEEESIIISPTFGDKKDA